MKKILILLVSLTFIFTPASLVAGLTGLAGVGGIDVILANIVDTVPEESTEPTDEEITPTEEEVIEEPSVPTCTEVETTPSTTLTLDDMCAAILPEGISAKKARGKGYRGVGNIARVLHEVNKDASAKEEVLRIACSILEKERAANSEMIEEEVVVVPSETSVYALWTAHPSLSITSTGNIVYIVKATMQDGVVVKHEIVQELGTFTALDTALDIDYSYVDAPLPGHDIYAYYQNTSYEGLSERYMFASASLAELKTTLTTSANNAKCAHYASNGSGSLTNSGSFWTEVCPLLD